MCLTMAIISLSNKKSNNKGKDQAYQMLCIVTSKAMQINVNLISQIIDLIIYNQSKHITLVCASLPTFTCPDRMSTCRSNLIIQKITIGLA